MIRMYQSLLFLTPPLPNFHTVPNAIMKRCHVLQQVCIHFKKHIHRHNSSHSCLWQKFYRVCGFSATQRDPCLNKCQPATRGLKKKKISATYWKKIYLVNHVMRPLAPGSRVTTPVGKPPPPTPTLSFSPILSPSSSHNNGEGCGSPRHTNDQVLNIYSTCSSASGSGWATAKPLPFFFFWYFYFHKTLLRPWMIIFKAGGVKASVWVVVEGYNKAYSYPTAEPKPGWWMIIDILLILRSYYTCGSVCVCFIL